MKDMVLLVILVIVLNSAEAQDKINVESNNKKPNMTEMHEQLAKAHQKAAECLKTGKKENECRSEFLENSKTTRDSNNCDMWQMHNRKK